MPNQAPAQRGFYISATKKSSGKTVVSLGLGAALSQSGLNVQSYKKGPDYIDPMWHKAATGRPCYNLDFFTQTKAEINACFAQHRQAADVVYVEGNKGLFDGLDTHGSDCNAALAQQLDLPVVLVVNTQGVTRGIAPLLSGYENFSENIQYAGVILNAVAGPRHQQKLIAAVETYTDLQVLGVVPRTPDLHLEERHLGLVPENEASFAKAYIERAAKLVQENVDIDALLNRSAKLAAVDEKPIKIEARHPAIKIGILRDAAFGFYYPDDLQAMQDLGAKLVFIDAINEQTLPAIDALFIGGGFPETQLKDLSSNTVMRQQIRQFVEDGKPVYAECGGLMYLCKELHYLGDKAEMVGVIDASVMMTSKPIGRGYAKIKARQSHLWGDGICNNDELYCHEFHYSKLEGDISQMEMAYGIKRGYGIDGQGDGIMLYNTLATYCHQRHTENNPWVKRFIDFIHSVKKQEGEID